MQISHVVPPSHLYLSDYGDYDFGLAHLCLADKDYKRFFLKRRKSGRVVYMDNGVWETGSPIEMDQMIELALEISPTYIYAPDYMGDMHRTLESVIRFGVKASAIADFRSGIIGVAQGSTFDEWFACVVGLSQLPEVFCHTIAINTLLLPDLYADVEQEGYRRTKTRLSLLEKIDATPGLSTSKRFYATGFGACIDARELLRFPWIQGVDTAIACVLASHSIAITAENACHLKPKGFIDKISFEDDRLAVQNMQVLNTWVSGGEPFVQAPVLV